MFEDWGDLLLGPRVLCESVVAEYNATASTEVGASAPVEMSLVDVVRLAPYRSEAR